jgi:hypothetical protein
MGDDDEGEGNNEAAAVVVPVVLLGFTELPPPTSATLNRMCSLLCSLFLRHLSGTRTESKSNGEAGDQLVVHRASRPI